MTNAEAISLLRGLEKSLDGYCELNEDGKKAFNKAISALEAQEWIPCSERLPEVGRSVLFSRRSMYTSEGCLQADGKWWQYWWDEMLNADQVTAWKPLPEAYREDGDGE